MGQKKILLVEDSETSRAPLEEELTEEGFKVVVAGDGETALSVAIKERPDLILLDLGLPKMDGLHVLEELRKDEWGKNAKVVILTIQSEIENVAEAMKYGVFDYVLKSDQSLGEVVLKVQAMLNT